VPLAPLTLVFGPNSAGKSTLLATLTLLAQSLSPSPTRALVMSGPLVDAGSFRMAVHNHDDSVPMTLGLVTTPRLSDGSLAATTEVVASYAFNPATRIPEATGLSVGSPGDVVSLVLPLDPADTDAVARREHVVETLQQVLARVAYLGPMRARPERTHAVGLTRSTDYVGPEGEALAEVLDASRWLIDEVNEWMDRLDLGYHVKLLAPTSRDVVLTAGDFTVVALLDVRRDPPVLVSSRGVGYGVGQLTPVVAQCLLSHQGVVVIEQPEVHIHPRLQAAVGDLLIHSVTERDNQVLVETHSEHLVLRLLRRVREGALAPDDLAVLYVEQHEDGAAFVRRLDVDADGELAGGWPGGFFDERLDEVFGGLA
jgi:energy-coupling factor transporter ATP-binding protein EcfA2